MFISLYNLYYVTHYVIINTFIEILMSFAKMSDDVYRVD